jgi:hypothetical protein
MKELWDKLSSYNFFNYVLPGVLFVVFARSLTPFDLVQENLAIAFFVYYFIGLVISRLGSLIVEPILKKSGLIRFADYPAFIAACEKDPKLEILSEQNNMFRTLCALFVSITVLRLYAMASSQFPAIGALSSSVVTVGLAVLFACAYRKQTRYVADRTKARTHESR